MSIQLQSNKQCNSELESRGEGPFFREGAVASTALLGRAWINNMAWKRSSQTRRMDCNEWLKNWGADKDGDRTPTNKQDSAPTHAATVTHLNDHDGDAKTDWAFGIIPTSTAYLVNYVE